MNLQSIRNFWGSPLIWYQSAANTSWCLIGCAAGDFGTIYVFQHYFPGVLTTLQTMVLATFNGLVTSIILETLILVYKKMHFRLALRTAFGMSFLSMLAMEAAMNLVDYGLTGGALIVWWVLPIALLAGFITPWPYNYWRLKKWGQACH